MLSLSLSFTFTFDHASPWNKGEPCSSSAFCFLILILSISLHSIPVVIHFMCWLGWDIVPRYVVKCYFGCFWDSIFRKIRHLKILTFKFVPFESSGLSSIHGWATSNWLKAWRDQKEWLPLRKGQFYQQITFGHELQHQFSFSLLAYVANFRHVCASRHTHACISSIVIAELIIDSVSLENPD